MSLDEIDHATTQRRIEAAAAGGLRALRESARASEDVDKQVREMRERQRHEKEAMDDRVARTERPAPRPAARTPRSGTLSLGADEFRETRQATKPAGPPAPPAARPPAPPAAEAPKPRPTLRLGAPDDRDDPPGAPEPSPPVADRPTPRRRRTGAEGEDDLSGRTWLR